MIYSAHSKSLALSGRPLSLEMGEPAPREELARLSDSCTVADPGSMADPCPTADPSPTAETYPVATASPISLRVGTKTDSDLATQIVARIEARVPGRIRHLQVKSSEHAVVLTGECSTFYSKQMAQHAAMGVLEYEQLINNIHVRTLK